VLESLIKSGACDAFGPRQVQLTNLDAILATAQREQRDRASGMLSLFGDDIAVSGGPLTGTEAPRRELLGWEKELLGIYLSEHPLQALAPKMGDIVTAYLAELKEAGDDLVTIACVVTNARKHITKNKQLMMFAQVEDLTGAVEVTVFPRVYESTANVWRVDEILLVLARVEERDEEPKLLCEHAVRFDDAGMAEIRRVAEERRDFLSKRARYGRNGFGNGSGATAPRRGNGQPARDAAIGSGTAAAPNDDDALPGPAAATPEEEAAPLVIRFREVLDYKPAIALFQRIQEVLKDHAGTARVVLDLPRNGGGMRRVHTSFRAKPSRELAEAVAREVGGDVVEVLLPR
jgi:hypothetical protein